MVHIFLKRCFAQRNPSRWQMWQSVHTFFTCGPWDQLSQTVETQWNTSHILFTVPPFTSLPQSATVSNFFHRLFTLRLRCSAILLITTVSWASSCCLMTFRCRSSSLTSAWQMATYSEPQLQKLGRAQTNQKRTPVLVYCKYRMIQPIAAKWATELILSLFICFISKVQWCRCHSNSSCYNSVLKGATCCSCSSVQHINALLERGLRNSCRPLWRLASLGDMKWCNWMQLVDGRWWFGWWLDQRSSAFQKMEVRVRWESSIWTWPTKNHSLSLKLWFWFWYRRYRSLWRLRYQTVSNILIPGHETNIDKHIS